MRPIRPIRPMRPKYLDLTEDERKALIWKGVLTGCGPNGWREGLIAEYDFKPACFQHDFEWWLGGTHEDRMHADKQFYKSMILRIRLGFKIKKYGLAKYYFFKAAAWQYHLAVSLWTLVSGPFKRGFRYGEPRTLEDISAAAEEFRLRSLIP